MFVARGRRTQNREDLNGNRCGRATHRRLDRIQLGVGDRLRQIGEVAQTVVGTMTEGSEDAGPLVIIEQPTRTEYVTREVHEHRAPTDQSVALLREMESAAKDEVIKAIHVGNTVFDCVVHTWRDDLSDSTKYRAIFSLNGKKLSADAEMPRGRHRPVKPTDEFELLREAVAREIAAEVLNDAFVAMMRERFR